MPGSRLPCVAVLVLPVLLLFFTGVEILPPARAAALSPGDGTTFQLEQKVRSAVLMDAASGRLLWAFNPDERQPIASVTKIMTLVLALEALQSGQVKETDPVLGSEHAKSMGGTQIWLEVGEELPYRDMLYAVAVGSANDAAVAIAEHLAGSEETFVARMNQRARELGMENTYFANATGLPLEGKVTQNHYSTARDVAWLSRHALTLPRFRELVSTYEYTMRPDSLRRPVLYSYNRLLRRYPGLDGIKTGFTNEAGYCISATAMRDGLRLIAVVLGASTRADRDDAVTALLNWGFRSFERVTVAKERTRYGVVRLLRGYPEQVNVVLKETISVTIPRGTKPNYSAEAQIDTDIRAPLAQGATVGWLVLREGAKEIGRVPLVTESEVRRATIWEMVKRGVQQLIRL
ncbi:MAG TPA: D-alanyl-D-alanine carboxypeptidase [Firmicutes bacterium]|nr:D-alanyl-D-alanine carboxypeptidase [Bacillota bacterium]